MVEIRQAGQSGLSKLYQGQSNQARQAIGYDILSQYITFK